MINKRFPITDRLACWVMWFIVGWAASTVIGMASSCGAAGPGLPGDDSCMNFVSVKQNVPFDNLLT